MPPDNNPLPPPHPAPNHLPPEIMPPINMAQSGMSRDEDLLEPGEQLVVIVRKHPIGIVGIYLESLIGLLAVFGLLVAVAPDLLDGLSNQAYKVLVAVFIFG